MRVSELFRLRFWSTGLIAVATIGTIAFPVSASAQSASVSGQTQSATDKIESWLRDAEMAMQQTNWESAHRCLQVAEALGQSNGQLPPEMAQRLGRMQAEVAKHRGGSVALAPAPLAPQTDPMTQASAQSAAEKLLQARRALAQGEVASAQALLKAARQSGVDFSQLQDSPDIIAGLIDRQNQLAEMARNGDANEYNRGAAEFLMEQSEALLNYRDWEASQFLAEQASKFPVDFGSTQRSPEGLLKQIAAAKASNSTPEKAAVAKLISQAQLAMDQQNWVEANRLVNEAKGYNLPESAYAANETRPWQLELLIGKAMKQKGLTGDTQFAAADRMEGRDGQVGFAGYDPTQDQTRNEVVGFNSDTGAKGPASAQLNDQGSGVKPAMHAMELYRSGLAALDQDDAQQAREYFEMAWTFKDELDPGTQQVIRDKLVTLSSATAPAKATSTQEEINLGSLSQDEQNLFRQVQKEVLEGRADADRMMRTEPRKALDTMVSLRARVANSKLSNASRAPLLTIIDRDINEMQKFIQDNLPDIMNDEANSDRLEQVELSRERRYEVEQRLQQLTEDFNKLVDQQRYAEAEMIARQAADLAPDSEITSLLVAKANMVNSVETMKDLSEKRERMQWLGMGRDMEEVGTPMDTAQPYKHGNGDEWAQRSRERLERLGLRQYRSEEERRIWNALKNQKIQGEYRGTLADAMNELSNQTGVNIAFDSMALRAESIDVSTTPIDQSFSQPISMQSAMNVLLGSVGLTFIVEDEVIKITSRDAQRKQVISRTYYVGDLVSPVTAPNAPSQMNFITPNQQMNTQNTVLAGNFGGNGMMNANQMMAGAPSALAMAQQMPGGQGLFGGMGNPVLGALAGYDNNGGGPQRGTPMYTTNGAPQLGGITLQDFQPLIQLITSTIAPDDWSTTQGEGTIQPYVPNLSLIVSQTQEVHDEIQDLLNQLRKLNDVQIVVEVRFITLGDNFFERIGVDFDFKLNDNSGLTPQQVLDQDSFAPDVVVGRDGNVDNFNPTADLDIGFFQNSIGSTIPTFGGFDPGTAANFGFAILSDIEVFFLIQASKGDQRTNLTQAPTVTMFNGQSASITDVSQRPFVTSVIPVVGDFAVAQQPIVSILPEGASLNVSAVASDDRRFVRLSMVPYFTEITDVQTFTFDGSRTTRQTNSSFLQDLLDQVGGGNNNTNNDPDLETVTQGTTIQQPVLAVTSISTVVSVPDGGTVLIGGIKRLSERRIERGVPFLSNIPYVNRLFKNVGIGRETTNLMMMVTPRIIIQEEEERKQVGPIGGN